MPGLGGGGNSTCHNGVSYTCQDGWLSKCQNVGSTCQDVGLFTCKDEDATCQDRGSTCQDGWAVAGAVSHIHLIRHACSPQYKDNRHGD